MHPLSAPQTIERARSLLELGRGAALPELLKLIETLSLDISSVTIPELAELIEKDAVILAKVLSVANLLAHNPGVAPLKTLSQAIHQIGYTRIRNIAVSLMLLETAGGACPAEQSEAAAHALCSGLMAQGAAEELGTLDGELAFVCAALRGLGRILMAAISPAHTRAAQKLTPEIALPDALRRFYGLTPIELSQLVLANARLPEEIVRTFRPCEPETLHGVSSTYDARLLGIADYGCRLSELALDAHDSIDAFDRKAATLARRFVKLVPGVEEIMPSVLQRADHRLRSFSRSHGGRSLSLPGLTRLRKRIDRRRAPAEANAASAPSITPAATTPAESLPAGAAAPGASPAAIDANANASTPVSTLEPQAALPGEGSPPDSMPANSSTASTPPAPAAATTPQPPVDLRRGTPRIDPLATMLAAVHHLLGADHCWLFQRPTASSPYALDRSVGSIPAPSPAIAQLHERERTVFGVCITRREVVILHDTGETNIRRYLPSWWHTCGRTPKAFALIPVTVAGETTAVILAGWQEPRRVTLADGQAGVVQEAAAEALGRLRRPKIAAA